MSLWLAVVIVAVSAVLTSGLIKVMMPALQRYALARPNARSSHNKPTPQGGGFAVVATVAIVLCVAALVAPEFRSVAQATLVFVLATLCLLGGIDDVNPLPVLPRLALEVACALALVLWSSGTGAVMSMLPVPVEVLGLTVGLVWFINLTNFMDGIDGITVAETVPVAGAVAFFAVSDLVPELGAVAPLALALTGAMLGFAPFNRHVARLFLGDAGSLAVGAALGTMLILLARSGHIAAAIILSLYYAADATITLYRRWRRGEKLSQAHRTHYYQLAIQRGFSVPDVTRRIWALNAILVALALVTILWPSLLIGALALAIAGIAVGAVLTSFERGRA